MRKTKWIEKPFGRTWNHFNNTNVCLEEWHIKHDQKSDRFRRMDLNTTLMVSKGSIKGIIYKENLLPITIQLDAGKSLTVVAGDYLEIIPLSTSVVFVTMVANPNKKYDPKDLEFLAVEPS